MVRGIQIIGVVVGVFFLYQSYKLLRDREENVSEFLLWTLIGFVLIGASLYPSAIGIALHLVGMENQVYFIFTIGILVLYVLLIHLFKLNRDLNLQISRLNEQMSILRYKMEKIAGDERDRE